MNNILGVKVDNLSREEILEKIKFFLREENPRTISNEKVWNKFHQIATVNPEFILQAQKDLEFKHILNSCDLNVADGAGIWFAFLRYGKYLKSRIAGIDLMLDILKLANANKLSIYLISHDEALSNWEETKRAILKIYPNMDIGGIEINKNSTNYQLQTTNYSIVFCNFGAPDQEKFLHSLKNLGNAKIRLAMGVGGSFDFLTGKRKRAPKFLQKIGLEWLWRFFQEPIYRAKRIWNAVVVFPIKIIINL